MQLTSNEVNFKSRIMIKKQQWIIIPTCKNLDKKIRLYSNKNGIKRKQK